MNVLELIVLWYVIGLVSLLINLLYRNYIKKDDIIIRVSDVRYLAGLALFGPILCLVPIFVIGEAIINRLNVDSDTIIWTNKRSRNRSVLFDKDDK